MFDSTVGAGGEAVPVTMDCDLVIVGAGSAGCVLAGRLSADPHLRVVLVEAGGPPKRMEIGIPAAFPKLFRTEVDWAYETEPQAGLGGRRLFWPRGKMLGGSSSMNAMIYIRGHRRIFDGWAETGADGWSFEEVLPVFLRSENFRPLRAGGARDPFHARGGPVQVAEQVDPNPLSRAFVEAAVAAGHERNDDFNGPRQAGMGLYHVTQQRGRRWSAFDAFLRPARKRPNLTILANTLATRVLFEGSRAVGLEIARAGGRETVRAGQVVLAGGAVNSPQLLMLSGVGPAENLRRAGLDVVHDLPGVGRNLQDHPIAPLVFDCTQPVSLANAESLAALARYLLVRRGGLTSNIGEAGGFVRVLAAADDPPDLQFHFAPSYFVNHGFENPEGHGFSIAVTLVAPRSRGRVRLASAKPTAAPAIDPAYLTEPEDVEILVRGLELGREILAEAPLAPYRGAERFPGAATVRRSELEAYLRGNLETLYHPVGTCKMGSDAMAVVDPSCRVRGLDRLWVADASIMPTIPNGNTHASTMMIAEKAAAGLVGEPGL